MNNQLEGNKAFLLLRPQIEEGKPRGDGEDSVAQLVEHDTFNVGVLGSSPPKESLAKASACAGAFVARL